MQLLRAALPILSDSRPGWWILHQIGNDLGGEFMYEHAGDVFEEIAANVEQYAGLSFERLEAGGIQWPCLTPSDPGTPILYTESFGRGRGRFLPLRFAPVVAAADDFPLLLASGRELYPYHKEVMDRDAHGLPALLHQELLRGHPDGAYRLGVSDGDAVRVTAASGVAGEFTAHLAEAILPGVVYVTYPIVDEAAEMLA
ncbi:MAG: formate dehydrogenase subunit alpha, partial [Chloroflexi bacterium]|nr:formate dehydrogenase subunit alpha [Chloroflexota bacterium]